MRERVTSVIENARPYVEQLAGDEELHEHVKKAYSSARKIYGDLLGDRRPSGLALRVARDRDIQDELRRTVGELRRAGGRVRGRESHAARNATLLMTGIVLGVLFNPATGPDTRRWLKGRLFGPEEPFAYEPNGQ